MTNTVTYVTTEISLAKLVPSPGATHEKLWVEPDRLLLTSKQSSTLRTYAFSQPR